MRAASWAAVSSRPQADKVSLEEQHRRNKEKINELGATCIADLTVPGISRKIVLFEDACRAIPAYTELRELVDRKQIDLLVFYVKSRLGRTMALCETVVAYCQAHGVAVYDLSAPPSTLDPAKQMRSAGDTITGAITSWQSQRESSELWQKHNDGMIGRIESGRQPGRVSEVWRRVYDPQGNEHLEINEEVAAPVRKILEWYANGHSLHAVTRMINEAGYHNVKIVYKAANKSSKRRPWTRSAIRSILDQAWTYAGYAQINKNSQKGREYARAKGNFPPIISEEIARRVDAERIAKKHVRHYDKPHFIYSGLLHCGVCNSNMNINSTGSRLVLASGEFRRYPMFNCHSCGRRVSVTKLRRALLQWFEELSKPETRLQLVADIDNSSTISVQSEMQHINARLQQIEESKAKANNAYIDGLMDRNEFATQKQRLATEEKELQALLTNAQRQLQSVRNVEETEQLLETMAQLGEAMLNDPNISEVNAWLRQNISATFDANREFHFALK